MVQIVERCSGKVCEQWVICCLFFMYCFKILVYDMGCVGLGGFWYWGNECVLGIGEKVLKFVWIVLLVQFVLSVEKYGLNDKFIDMLCMCLCVSQCQGGVLGWVVDDLLVQFEFVVQDFQVFDQVSGGVVFE